MSTVPEATGRASLAADVLKKSRAALEAREAQVEAEKALVKATEQVDKAAAEFAKVQAAVEALAAQPPQPGAPNLVPDYVQSLRNSKAAEAAQLEAKKAAEKATKKADELAAQAAAPTAAANAAASQAPDASTTKSKGSGLQDAVEGQKTKADADKAAFAENLEQNQANNASAKRARQPADPDASPERRQRPRRATTAANNDPSSLFRMPISQHRSLSPEEIDLERQRLTTAYDPLMPPADDPTTAEGVKMGVVTDVDGRHWRQQSMRLGRWISVWKGMRPFASEPAEVGELTKAEKRWLDIKFRRRVARRRVSPRAAPGRGSTTQHWESRLGGRRVYSGRVHPPTPTRPYRKPGSGGDGGGGDDDDDGDPDPFAGVPPQTNSSKPSSSRQARGGGGAGGRAPPKGPSDFFPGWNLQISTRPDPLVNGVLIDYGLSPSVASPIREQLVALLTEEVLGNLPSNPMAADLPEETRAAMGDVLKKAGVLPANPADPPAKGSGDPSNKDPPSGEPKKKGSESSDSSEESEGSSAEWSATEEEIRERVAAVFDLIREAGVNAQDVPPSSMDDLFYILTMFANAGVAVGSNSRSRLIADIIVPAAKKKAAASGGQNRPEGPSGEDPNLELLFTRAGVPRSALRPEQIRRITNVLEAGAPGRVLSPAFSTSVTNYIRGYHKRNTRQERRGFPVWIRQTSTSRFNRVDLWSMERFLLFFNDSRHRLATEAEIAQIRLEPGVVPSRDMQLSRCVDPDTTGQEVFVSEEIAHHYIKKGETKPLPPGNPSDSGRKKGVPIFNLADWMVAIPDEEQERKAPSDPTSPLFVDAGRLAADQNRYWIRIEDSSGTRLLTRPTSEPGHQTVDEDEMRRILVGLNDDLSSSDGWVERREVSTGVRVWVREDRASEYRSMQTRLSGVERLISLDTLNGDQLWVNEVELGTALEHNGATITGCLPSVWDFEEPWDDLLVDLLYEGDRMSIPRNKAGDYVKAVVNPPSETAGSKLESETGVRMVTLRPLDLGPDLVVPETLVGTLPEHENASIVSCDPPVDDSEAASQRIVRVMHSGGDLEYVSDNKLGSHTGSYIAGVYEKSDAAPTVTSADAPKLTPPPLSRTIDLLLRNGVEINLPVSDVDNFKYGAAVVRRDSVPPCDFKERQSGRSVWITTPNLGPLPQRMDAAFLGAFVGATIAEPKAVPPDRQVQLRGPTGIQVSVPVEQVSNETHQGFVIVATDPVDDPLEGPSERLVRIRTGAGTDMNEVTVPDNHLGQHVQATILPPLPPDIPLRRLGRPANQDRLIVMRLPDGREVRVPVASVGPEGYAGATITASEPPYDFLERFSGRIVRVTANSKFQDVQDNQLGLNARGWQVAPYPAPNVEAPRTGTGLQDFLAAPANNGVYLTAEDIRKRGLITTSGRPPIVPAPYVTPQTGNTTSAGQTGTGGDTSAQGGPNTGGQGTTQPDNTGTGGDTSAQGGLNTGGQGTNQPDNTGTGGDTSAQGGLNTGGQGTNQPDNTGTGGDTSAQGGPNTGGQGTNQPDKTGTQPNSSSKPNETEGDAVNAETNAGYPRNITAPEYIQPTNKPHPYGRPDNTNRWGQPPPPRGDPMEKQRIRLRDQQYVRRLEEAVAAAAAGTRTEEGTVASRIQSIVGSMIVTAGGTPSIAAAAAAAAAAADGRTTGIEGASRANVPPRATSGTADRAASTVVAKRAQATRTASKSPRVAKKPGKGAGATRDVRSGSLPAEEEETGLRTRSGALYSSPQGKSGSGSGKGGEE